MSEMPGGRASALPEWTPPIETVTVNNDELAPQGGGEVPMTTTGAVVANALFDATGARPTQLPMLPDRARKAIGCAKRSPSWIAENLPADPQLDYSAGSRRPLANEFNRSAPCAYGLGSILVVFDC
jgi:hypothetical protein